MYRWFCFLTIDDPVFDHSTISYFIERIGREGFSAIFHGLNEELLRLGLLSPEMYVDSSLVKANVHSHQLSRSGLSVAEFRERAIKENGLFVLSESGVDEDGVAWEETRYFQDSKGFLPLSPVDTDARWRTSRPSKPPELNYQDNAIVDRNGFILSRGVTHASEGEWKALPNLLEQLPLQPVSLAADTAYNAGRLRQTLEERGITAYIPIHPRQESNTVARGDFEYRGRPSGLSPGQGAETGCLSPAGPTATSTWRDRRTARLASSKTSAFLPIRNAGIWACHLLSAAPPGSGKGTGLPSTGGRWCDVRPLSRGYSHLWTGWDGQKPG